MGWLLRLGVAGALVAGALSACGGDSTTFGDPGGTAGAGGDGATGGGTTDGGAAGEGGTSSANGGGGDGGMAAGGAGGGGGCAVNNSGDCDSPADCGGAPCVEITTCGFRVCERAPDEATECNTPGLDDCCNTTECVSGTCHVAPYGAHCGGLQQAPHNECLEDECSTAVDCGADPGNGLSWQCVPPGTFGNPVNACVLSNCTTDADCTAEAGGICAPVQRACCNAPVALYCVYPTNGCRRQQDCSNQSHCDFDGTGASCVAGPAICPP